MRGAVWVWLLLAIAAFATVASATPDPRYWRYGQIVDTLQAWAARYPDILHCESIGTTLVDHQPIWAMRISDNAAVSEPEPRLIFHAAQHSNEANGTNAIMMMARGLLSGYGSDPSGTGMVDSLEIWLIPVLNPDGYRMAFSSLHNAADWRKTKRQNDGNGAFTCPEDGVDLNRNWDFRWAEYDSIDTASYYYKGPYPWSEPEAVAIRDMILRERPIFVMDYHSPFTGHDGNCIWWPWRDASGLYGPDASIYRPISQRLGELTQSEVDTIYYNGLAATIDVLPKEQNWVYANTGICILLMEISLTNWWEGAVVDTIAARVARGSLYLMTRALRGPGLTGTITDAATGLPLEGDVTVAEFYQPRIAPHRSEAQYGRYWRLLNGGDYAVTVSAPGHYPETRAVTVERLGWTELDVPLTPLDPSALPAGPATAERILHVANPAGQNGGIGIFLSEESKIRLELTSVSGRRVARLIDETLAAGEHTVRVPAGLPTGVYLLDLRTEHGRERLKLMQLK